MILLGIMVLLLAMLPAVMKRAGWFTILVCLASAMSFGGYLKHLLIPGVTLEGESLPWLSCSPLAAWFGLIFSLGFPIGTIYAQAYLKAHPTKGMASHLIWLSLMFISMHLVLLSANSLIFMLSWELMSLSSFLAILYDRDSEETRSGALYYLVTMQIGAMVLLAGFAFLYLESGSFMLDSVRIGGYAKWLLLAGFAFKAGFFPLYSWLPKAHPVAPSHLSGMMSGLMIKTGIFGIIWVMLSSSWQAFELYILLAISLITAFNGVIHAMAEGHLKRSLAYSSIENIGIIGIAICFWQLGLVLNNPAMASLALLGALLHCLFHSIFKSMLFYLSGNVLLACHSLDCNALGGLDKRMSMSSKLFLGGMASISALPLFCGFISELVIFSSIILGFGKASLAQSISSAVAGAILAIVSALALIAFTKLYSIVFGGNPRSEAAAKAVEPGASLLISPMILGILSLVFGLFGWLPLSIMDRLLQEYGLTLGSYHSLVGVLQMVSLVLGMLLICFFAIYFVKCRICKTKLYPTWGCGYHGTTGKMQYTANAYIDPLSYFLKPLLYKRAKLDAPKGYFPGSIAFEEQVTDYLDSGLIRSSSTLITRFLKLFSGIHNGRTNSYITWLLIALIALLIWVLGVK